MVNIKISKLKNKEWEKFKILRLEALKEVPEAFSSSFEEESKRTDKEWKNLFKNSNILFALKEDKLIRMSAIYSEKNIKQKHIANI